ncbi:hypothetical protein CTZ27_26645 [Streptomyces griseocarneus]|nr:hypothetical protein CTZ27_26645 [Streptomyces griseocarneus]
MSSGHKTMTAFLTVICALVLAIAGLSLGWPLWVWPVLGVVLVTGASLTVKAVTRPKGPIPRELTLEPDVPIPHLERWERIVTDVALPSALDDYDFLFSATIRWCPSDAPGNAPYVNAGALAVDAVLERAQQVTALQPPHRSSLAQHQLNGTLGTMLPDPTGRVKAMAEGVTLRLTGADLERLNKLSTVRKDEDVWEHERNWERNKRAYLRNDVLQDTGSAVVWWMAKNDDQVERTVDLIGPLAQLASAANNKEIPEEFRYLLRPPPIPEDTDFQDMEPPAEDGAADFLEAMMSCMGIAEDNPERALFVRRVTDALTAPGLTDDDDMAAKEAEEIRQRFDAPPSSPEDGGDQEAGDDRLS